MVRVVKGRLGRSVDRLSAMTWRGPIVLVLLLGIGLAVGYGVAQGVRETPSGAGGAVPVAARSPSVPVDPPPTVLPDPGEPGLASLSGP